MKTIWKGTISFGLVNIPIKLYSAVQQHSLGFTMLHSICHTPIRLQRWCEHCKQTVAWEDIVKGFKKDDGTFFVVTQESLAKLKPENTESIRILEFVDYDALDPILFDQHYYIGPQHKKDTTFFLFVHALQNLNRVAIGQYVFRDKEHVGAIQAYDNGLLLTTLNYGYEIRPMSEIPELAGTAPELFPQELRLAEQLITKLTVKKFDINRFKDSFAEKLKEAIKKHKKGVKPKATVKQPKAKAPKAKAGLVDVLKESLRQYQPTSRPAARASAGRKTRKKA